MGRAGVRYVNDRAGLQERIASEAARRMVVDGEDAEAAKRKSALALLGEGANHRGVLPDGEQLGSALRTYLRTFGGPAQHARLQAQRRVALDWMERLEAFAPRLVGAVLDASATDSAPIEIELFADSAKEVELALLALGVDFRTDGADGSGTDGRRRHRLERIGFVAPLDANRRRGGTPGLPVLLTVCDPVALRTARGAPSDPELHPVERAGRADAAMLRRLLDDAGPAP
jgi:hypothetical protein